MWADKQDNAHDTSASGSYSVENGFSMTRVSSFICVPVLSIGRNSFVDLGPQIPHSLNENSCPIHSIQCGSSHVPILTLEVLHCSNGWLWIAEDNFPVPIYFDPHHSMVGLLPTRNLCTTACPELEILSLPCRYVTLESQYISRLDIGQDLSPQFHIFDWPLS